MNKIIVDTKEFDIKLQEDSYIEINHDSKVNLIVERKKIKVLLNVKNHVVDINLEILDDGNLEVNNLGINSSINYNIRLHNNTNLLVVDSILTRIDSINNINIEDIGNNNKILFYSNGINLENNKLYFNLNGIIRKNSNNSYLEENSKIFNIMDGDSKIIPNLIVDTKEVVANHSAFIGTFKNEDLYYLMSRGITKNNSKKLLIKSILLSNMNLNIEKFIKEISEFIVSGGDILE